MSELDKPSPDKRRHIEIRPHQTYDIPLLALAVALEEAKERGAPPEELDSHNYDIVRIDHEDPVAVFNATRARQRKRAKKATGPTSEEGKAKVSQNARKHGFCSVNPCVEDEDAGAYAIFAKEIAQSFGPRTPMQKMLVEQICSLQWRLRRILEAQAKIFYVELEKNDAKDSYIQKLKANNWRPIDEEEDETGEGKRVWPCDLLAERFARDPHNGFILLNRYERSTQNALFQTMREYDRLVKQHPDETYLEEEVREPRTRFCDLKPDEDAVASAPAPADSTKASGASDLKQSQTVETEEWETQISDADQSQPSPRPKNCDIQIIEAPISKQTPPQSGQRVADGGQLEMKTENEGDDDGSG